MDPNGKGIIVAGGAGHLGRAIAAALCRRGAQVAIIDNDAHGAEKIATLEVTYVRADAGDDASAGRAIANVAAKLHRIDALINCTGSIHSEPLINLLNKEQRRHRRDTWDKVIYSNLTATFTLTARVVEHMALARTKGVIVNFSSVSAAGNPGQSAYSAAKAGIEALTVVWARELGPLGIRVVAIAPGFVETGSTRKALSEASLKDCIRRTPLGRLAAPDEIATSVIFVLENDFLTGRTIAIDGGVVV